MSGSLIILFIKLAVWLSDAVLLLVSDVTLQ